MKNFTNILLETLTESADVEQFKAEIKNKIEKLDPNSQKQTIQQLYAGLKQNDTFPETFTELSALEIEKQDLLLHFFELTTNDNLQHADYETEIKPMAELQIGQWFNKELYELKEEDARKVRKELIDRLGARDILNGVFNYIVANVSGKLRPSEIIAMLDPNRDVNMSPTDGQNEITKMLETYAPSIINIEWRRNEFVQMLSEVKEDPEEEEEVTPEDESNAEQQAQDFIQQLKNVNEGEGLSDEGAKYLLNSIEYYLPEERVAINKTEKSLIDSILTQIRFKQGQEKTQDLEVGVDIGVPSVADFVPTQLPKHEKVNKLIAKTLKQWVLNTYPKTAFVEDNPEDYIANVVASDEKGERINQGETGEIKLSEGPPRLDPADSIPASALEMPEDVKQELIVLNELPDEEVEEVADDVDNMSDEELEVIFDTPEVQKAIEDAEKSDDKSTSEFWNKIQAGLDLVGLEPSIGTAADIANTIISAVRVAFPGDEPRKKHLGNMIISGVSIVPFGDFAKLLKAKQYRQLAKNLVKGAKEARKTAKAAKAGGKRFESTTHLTNLQKVLKEKLESAKK